MCDWRSESDPLYRCKVPAEGDSNYCIFHQEAEDKDISKFKAKFYEQIDERGSKETRNPNYNFCGYVFPMGLKVSDSGGETEELILPKEVKGDLVISEATIDGDFAFKGGKITGDAVFWKAAIKGDADFSHAAIKGDANFRAATIKWFAVFSCATIEGKADFGGIKIGGSADFSCATIEGKADFGGIKIGGIADFKRASFEEGAEFFLATIKGFADFSHATIEGDADFEATEASYISLGPRRPTILWWEKNREGVTLKAWSKGYSFWRFARTTFEKMEAREKADAAYYFEKVWQRRASLAGTRREKFLAGLGYPFDLMLFRLPIAYGTSLIRPIITWFLVITLFAGVYAGVPSLIGRTVKSIWQLSNWLIAFHFSVTTFTTLGLGDIHPTRLWGRVLTSMEAVIGGLLMALTVVVVSRKFMR